MRAAPSRPSSAPPPFSLVPLDVRHAPAMAAVLADPALYRFTGGEPPGAEALAARYARQLAGPGEPGVAWVNLLVRTEEGGAFAGYVQATGRRGEEAELAWVVGTAWQGRGLAKAAARALADRLAAAAGVRRLTAYVHPEHAASEAVAHALGLRPDGSARDGERRWAGPAPVSPVRTAAP
ncbi:GNAT family N-acetyltransferase [Streptomyces sp. SPB074]|uniref:GNAT family N-acetyltransferase n=1 Tax=Streptomyces sp. (strain SPB074) TaxID=465543 RepID=UPI00017F1B8E|nr:GNAT family N-acetyltransferase [Streptomyces sp. SPB074]EDY46222.1 acetyltransferase [Streptomyces sp. SPB074]